MVKRYVIYWDSIPHWGIEFFCLLEPTFKFRSQCGASSTYCLFGQMYEYMLPFKGGICHSGQLPWWSSVMMVTWNARDQGVSIPRPGIQPTVTHIFILYIASKFVAFYQKKNRGISDVRLYLYLSRWRRTLRKSIACPMSLAVKRQRDQLFRTEMICYFNMLRNVIANPLLSHMLTYLYARASAVVINFSLTNVFLGIIGLSLRASYRLRISSLD